MFGTLKRKLLLSMDDYFGIADGNGRIVICSDESAEGDYLKDIDKIDIRTDEIEAGKDLFYLSVRIPGKLDHIAFVSSEKEENKKLLRLVVLFVESFFNNLVEGGDYDDFCRKVLQGELGHEELRKGMELYRIRDKARRAVLVLHHTEAEYSVADMISNIIPDDEHIIVELNNGRIACIILLKDEEGIPYLNKICRSIVATIEEELMVSVQGGIGNIVETFAGTAVSCANAELALSVGDIFEYENNVSDYNTLGIGKLIYTSDKKVLEDFLTESVSRKTFELLDDEIIKTVQSFFKNNLNISETARQMYLHRNTLVYRIEKVMKITGLDLRNFDDAVSFKAAYMVKCYIDKLNQER
ncbi:MAG TPA: helix-turn-helix domain-containing protein [Clostridia bacterium]|nr:helix-turn-helix domain-containing protein [Clostridia bacterium]HRX41950.1 helix-turn-helix domain-containing protein [Clostridia bacterium]